MVEMLLAIVLLAAGVAGFFSILGYTTIRRSPAQAPLNRIDLVESLRLEGDAIRDAVDVNASSLRQELGQNLAQNQSGTIAAVAALSDSLLKQVDAFGARLESSNKTTETRID